MTESFSRVPWSTQPSLKEKTEEVGIDFDSFIEGLSSGKSDQELAKELNSSSTIIKHLRTDFEHYGIHSIMGQD